MEKNINVKIMGVFASILLLFIVITASFAYFGSFDVNLNNNVAVNINAVSPGNATFISSATQLNLQVPAANMSQTVADNTVAAASNTATLTVNLAGAANLLTTCTYDIVYEYDSTSNVYGKSPTTKNSNKEITLQVSNVNGTNNFANEKNFDYDSSWTNNKRTLVSGASISSMGSLTTQNISITGKYYNLTISQSSLEGKSFTGKIYVTNHKCETSDGAALTILKNNGGESSITELDESEFANVTTASDKGMYKKADDLGTSYYYRGAVNNNWIRFGKEPNKCMYNNSEVLYAEIVGDELNIRKVKNQEECLSTNMCMSQGMYGVGINETVCQAAGGTPLTEKAAFTTADMYWRIIRINGDGSIRMIYSGTTAPTSATATVMTGPGTQISISTFNDSMDKAEYVGYQYIKGQQHGFGKCDGTNNASCTVNGNTVYNSTIKQTIDKWYAGTTLKDNDLIADQIFCNDRAASTSDVTYSNTNYTTLTSWNSTGTQYSYGASGRLTQTTKSPQLICPTESDKFTVNTSNGNGALTYPVGLITADEVAMAGGQQNSDNSSYYLYTNEYYWSGSPYSFYSALSYAYEFGVSTYGGGGAYIVSSTAYGARPVVSLSSKAKISGNGTYSKPYTVS